MEGDLHGCPSQMHGLIQAWPLPAARLAAPPPGKPQANSANPLARNTTVDCDCRGGAVHRATPSLPLTPPADRRASCADSTPERRQQQVVLRSKRCQAEGKAQTKPGSPKSRKGPERERQSGREAAPKPQSDGMRRSSSSLHRLRQDKNMRACSVRCGWRGAAEPPAAAPRPSRPPRPPRFQPAATLGGGPTLGYAPWRKASNTTAKRKDAVTGNPLHICLCVRHRRSRS